jgi:signal transduction histidine kinase
MSNHTFPDELFQQARQLEYQAEQAWHSHEYELSYNTANQALNILHSIQSTIENQEMECKWLSNQQDMPLLIHFYDTFCSCFNTLSIAARMLGRYEQSLHYAARGITFARKYKLQKNLARLLMNQSAGASRMGNYPAALQDLNEALSIAVGTNNILGIANIYNNIGIIYWFMTEFENALYYYNKSMEMYKKANKSDYIEQIYINIACVYLDKVETDTAIQYLLMALEQNVHTNNKLHKAHIYTNLGNAHFQQKEYEKSLEYYLNSYNLHQEMNAIHNISIILRNLGLVYSRPEYINHDYTKAEEYLCRAIAMLEESGDNKNLHNTLHLLAEVVAAQYRWKEATSIMQRCIQVRRMELNEESNKEIQKTKIKLLEREKKILEEKNEELRILHAEKNEYIAIASHDLKNPLSSITIMAQTLASADISIKQRQAFHRNILDLSSQMYTLIKKLLDDNALDQGMMTAKIQNIHVYTLITKIIRLSTNKAQHKNIKIYFDMQDKNIYALCDQDFTEQILNNLVDNAIKFSYPDTTITIDCALHQNMMAISIIDQGSGISPEDMPLLFNRFTQKHQSAQKALQDYSTDLGLSIAVKMAKLMHGTIECSNMPQPAQGACFTLLLPAATQN